MSSAIPVRHRFSIRGEHSGPTAAGVVVRYSIPPSGSGSASMKSGTLRSTFPATGSSKTPMTGGASSLSNPLSDLPADSAI